MAKKAARKSTKAAAPRTPRKVTKAAAKPKAETAGAVHASPALMVGAVVTTSVVAAKAGPVSKTAKFTNIQVTITLSGSGAPARCDIAASTADGVSAQTAGFGNSVKPLLTEVLAKLSSAYPSEPSVSLGLDDTGDLVPTG